MHFRDFLMNLKRADFLKALAVTGLWGVTFLVTGWLFLLLAAVAGIITYYVVGLYVYRNREPWRRIYFPLIQRYAFLGAAHVRLAELAQAEFHPRKPLGVLLKEFQPAYTEHDIERILARWQIEFETFADADLFQEIFQEAGTRSEDMSDKLMNFRAAMFDPKNYNSCFVRHAIGQIISAKAGIEQKKRYWKALLSQKVS